MLTMSTDPASAEQCRYLDDIIELMSAQGHPEVDALRAKLNAGMTKREASRALDYWVPIFKEAKRRPYQPVAPPPPDPVRPQRRPVPPVPGFYRHGDQVVRVTRPDNKWTVGHILVTPPLDADGEPVGNGSWERAPKGTIWDLRPDELISLGDAASWGRTSKICMRCGARLDDPKSKERGLGPVCAKRWGK